MLLSTFNPKSGTEALRSSKFFPRDIFSQLWQHWQHRYRSTCVADSTSEPFLVILCDTLFRRLKLIFFTFESAETYRFLYIKDASFSRKILLKLIHLKSRNSGVTWSRFKYFLLLATFAAKLKHFCTSCCSFSLHLPHIELQSFS